MEYIKYIKAKTHTTFAGKSEKPVLSEEDEQFLTRITSANNPRPFSPDHGGDAQLALMDGAQNIALPEETVDELLAEEGIARKEAPASTEARGEAKKRATWSWLRRDSRDRRMAEQTSTADSLHDIAVGLKPADARPNEDGSVSDEEAKREEEDMTVVLETLNLAAVNNRVFSISDETQDLLANFNQIFRDLMKGVPTAYNDLESLLTNGDQQLQKTYESLPPFLQKLIQKLPESMTKGIGPGLMAAAAENAKPDSNLARAGKAAGAASKWLKTPNLKDLVAPGRIATLLSSIMNFLRARFPAFFGMNVLWSLAMFVLLIVFWYCHKRGREVRLEREDESTAQEIMRMDIEWRARHPEALTTSAATQPLIEGTAASVPKEGPVRSPP